MSPYVSAAVLSNDILRLLFPFLFEHKRMSSTKKLSHRIILMYVQFEFLIYANNCLYSVGSPDSYFIIVHVILVDA